MTALLAEVVLPHVSGVPRNNFVNTFAFATTTAAYTQTEVDKVIVDLTAFYNTGAGGQAVGAYLGEQVSRSLGTIVNIYDLTGHLDGTAHGAPVFSQGISLPASAVGSELPSELAICLSFRGSYAGDAEFGPGTRPRARDRGRVYLGPITTQAVAYDGATGLANVPNAVRVDIANAGAALRDATGHAWSVWSRRNATLVPITTVWVDNAFDIQRRRGELATARTFR